MPERRAVNPERLKVGLSGTYAMNGPQGGVRENILQIRKHLEGLGHIVHVFSPRNPDVAEAAGIIPFGVSHPVEHDGTIAHIHRWPLLSPLKIWALKNSVDLDIANYHEPQVNLPVKELMPITPWLNVVTFHAHNELKKRYYLFKLLGKAYSRFIDSRVVVSEAVLDAADKYFPGDYNVIPNGVDTSRFSPDNEKIDRFVDDKINILYVGRLERRKGAHLLLNALGYLKDLDEQIRVILVGDGENPDELKAQAACANLTNVYFEGRVSDDDLPKYYATAHIFVAPATHNESQGVVNLEAMASGLPIVAGDNPGYRTTVTPETGFLIDPTDTQGFAQTLRTLIDNSELRREMGEAGLALSKSYDWNVIGQQVLDLFLETLMKKGKI